MSAYIIDDKTINTIATYIFNDKNKKGIDNVLHSMSLDIDVDINTAAGLAQAMVSLNYDSVNQRYKSNDHPHSIKYINKQASLMQTYKSLCSFLYQSCEGNCIVSSLYQALAYFRDKMAVGIVRESKDYLDAEWS